MSTGLIYSLILLSYAPGVLSLFFYSRVWKFQILVFSFLGMLMFGAIGSINILGEFKVYPNELDISLVAEDYALALIVQVFIFYFCTAFYILFREPKAISLKVTRFDDVFIGVGVFFIFLLAGLYYSETKTFLMLSFIDGSMTNENAYLFREKYIYGLAHWPIYNLGFTMLPILISIYSFLRVKVLGRVDLYFYLSMMICFAASLSMGSKAGLIVFVLTFAIAKIVYLSNFNKSLKHFFKNKKLIFFSVFCVTTLIGGYIKATPESISVLDLFERLWHRVFVVYTEAIAGAIGYTREVDFLGMEVFPNIRGFLQHTQVNIPLVMHQYISHGAGGVTMPFVGEAFLVSGWSTVLILCTVVFHTLIVLQELVFRLNFGICSLVFTAYYSYLALMLSAIGMFSTLYTFMYPGAWVTLIAVSLIVTKLMLPAIRNLRTMRGRS